MSEENAPPAMTQAPTKAAELAKAEQRLAAQRKAVVKKERELAELQARLAEQQRSLDVRCRETGARDQRINVNTLVGVPKVNQAGNEMALAIKRRNVRRREKLSDKNTKLMSKLEKQKTRGSQATLLTPRGMGMGGGSTATTPRGSVSRVSPADEDAPAAAPKPAGSSAPATGPCCDRVVPMATEPSTVVTPA